MPAYTSIEWTEATWNPVTGCTPISPGCKNCYAERMARRLQAMGLSKYRNGFTLTMHPHTLRIPLYWKKPKMIFVNSMSDLFHEDITDEFIQQVFMIMRRSYWHTFQVLTKRADRLVSFSSRIDWPANVWIGVSVENAEYTSRIDALRTIAARVRFLSIEPLLGPLPNLSLEGIHWVIVGGESGPGARPLDESWVIDLLTQCQKAQVPFFFKQWGGTGKEKGGRTLLGRTWEQTPGFMDRNTSPDKKR